MCAVKDALAVLTLAGVVLVGFDASRYNSHYQSERQVIAEDPFHLHEPEESFWESYLSHLGHSINASIDKLVGDENSQKKEADLLELRKRADLLKRIHRAGPEDIDKLEIAVHDYDYLDKFRRPIIEDGIKALARLGAVDALQRFSHGKTWASQCAAEEVRGLHPDIDESISEIRKNAEHYWVAPVVPYGWDTPMKTLVYEGTEDGLREFIRLKAPTALGVFVNMHYKKPFVHSYKEEIIELLERAMKYPNGRFNCDTAMNFDLVNYGSAIRRLDSEYAGKLAAIIDHDCEGYGYGSPGSYGVRALRGN